MSTIDPVAIGADIEALVTALSASPSPAAADARRLVERLMMFYGAGLSRMLDIVRAERGAGALPARFAADPLVASILALHDLAPRADAGLIQIIRPAHGERCEVCHAEVNGSHVHLVDVETRRLVCACTVCGSTNGRYRRVPSRYVHGPSMTIAPADWDALGIPVGLVFFFVNSQLGRVVACYPGPAGATESLLPLDAWPTLASAHPWIDSIAPDVEAMLVRQVQDEYRCFIVPIDICYELVGRLRRTWEGVGGGRAMEDELSTFFDDVLRKAGGAQGPA